KLLGDWPAANRPLPPGGPAGRKVALVTGVMAAPVIERLAHHLRRVAGLEIRVLPVANRFWGELVTVAGLLCGQDVLDELAARCAGFAPDDLILLPRVMLDTAGGRFLVAPGVGGVTTPTPPRAALSQKSHALVGDSPARGW